MNNEKKYKKGKCLPEESLQIAVNREVKGKGERERYTHLNTEFQRIARRNKGNISYKDGHDKGQKWYGPNRSQRD